MTILKYSITGGCYLGFFTAIPGALDELKDDKPYRKTRALLAFGIYGIAGAAVGVGVGGTAGLVKVVYRGVKSKY